MSTIPVRVCGDHWVNPEEVRQQILSSPLDHTIVLDFLAEGPSMTAMGITSMLDEICQQQQRDPSNIKIINNPNTQEQTGYINITPGRSHFFSMSRYYWTETQPVDLDARRFGLFLGRATQQRAQIMRDCLTAMPEDILVSRLESPATLDWAGRDPDLARWWKTCGIGSIDGHIMRDQFRADMNTNLDLVQHYHKFRVEIVAETYCLGDTFFPTEKTVRPIMAAKPMVVFGPRYFLRRLRDMGFETWRDLWDESYDDLEGPARWAAMAETIDYIRLTEHWIEPAAIIAHTNRLHLADLRP